MNNYQTFIRTWYRRNKDYPNGLEPHPGRKSIVRKHLTMEEARRMCEQYNNDNYPGPLSRKMEFETM